MNRKKLYSVVLLILILTLLSGCAPAARSNPEYEARQIHIEGALEGDDIVTLSVSELRGLPQYELEAGYKRTTGLYEEFQMSGPSLKEVIALAGADIYDYEGIGVIGRDSYYCLISADIIASTPEEHLLIALNIDGRAELDEVDAPARLAVQGQFGPYWVRQIDKIVLYREVPRKEITSVWVFEALAEGIEPYEYEYYGSKDRAIDLEQVFSRLDSVDSKAFFSMKSSDGFLKNEAMNMVRSRYYIKTEGQDAPTNVSPYIKLGMNVHHIAWFSTSADAAVFPAELLKYMDTVQIGQKSGIPLDELLYEVKVENIIGKNFDILDTQGNRVTVGSQILSKGILTYEQNIAGIEWDESTGLLPVGELMRIRVSDREPDEILQGNAPADGPEQGEIQETPESPETPEIPETPEKPETPETNAPPAVPEAPSFDSFGRAEQGKEIALTLEGEGLQRPLYLSLEELKSLEEIEQVFSIVNNWPVRKMAAARGVTLDSLLKRAGIRPAATLIRLEAEDGYKAQLTMEQLNEKRYAFPQIQSMKSEGRYQILPMVSWAYEAGVTDPSKAREGDLKFHIGQRGLNDVNTAVSVSMLNKITVLNTALEKWEPAAILREQGEVSFEHDYLDQIKIYYTLDGSEPDENSMVYNPSTTYFQPELIKPLELGPDITLKAKIYGYGRRASDTFVSEGVK